LRIFGRPALAATPLTIVPMYGLVLHGNLYARRIPQAVGQRIGDSRRCSYSVRADRADPGYANRRNQAEHDRVFDGGGSSATGEQPTQNSEGFAHVKNVGSPACLSNPTERAFTAQKPAVFFGSPGMLRVLGRVRPCATSLAVARSGLLAGSTIFVTNYADTVRHENPISAGCSLFGRICVAFDDGLSSTLVRRAARSTVPSVAGLCHDSLPHSSTVCNALCAVSTSGAGLCAVPTSGAGLPSVPSADAGVSAGVPALPCAGSGVRADLCTAK